MDYEYGYKKHCPQCQQDTQHWPVSTVFVRKLDDEQMRVTAQPHGICDGCGMISPVELIQPAIPAPLGEGLFDHCPACGGALLTFAEAGTGGLHYRQRCREPKTSGCLS